MPHSIESSPARPSAAASTAHQARVFQVCLDKTRRNIERLADDPRSAAFAGDGNYFAFPEGFFDIGNWTSSFFTGMALLAFEATKDLEYLQQTNRLADHYREKVTRRSMDTMHDLGFLYSLYSVGLHKLTGDLDHRRTALCAADVLAKRFVPAGSYLRAWGRMDDDTTEYAGLAIIDCMMNLPLLFWASEETGHRFYAEIAMEHADTTMAHFVRADDSVFHAYRFDLKTGAPERGDNYCGHRVDTHWARGTAWAIYGFALAHRYTGAPRYLELARRLARKFIALLDDEVVPIWDFALPPGSPEVRDSSAGSIAVCGLQELLVHFPADAEIREAADALLGALCTDYVDSDPECPGILKDAQVGDGMIPGTPSYGAKNAFTSWGDYYLMEALARNLHGLKSYW